MTDREPLDRFTAEFADPDYPTRGVVWVSCGDYQQQDIQTWYYGIVAVHGKDSVGRIQQDPETEAYYFEIYEEVDWDAVSKHIGITHSGPSMSSSSSTADIIRIGEELAEAGRRVTEELTKALALPAKLFKQSTHGTYSYPPDPGRYGRGEGRRKRRARRKQKGKGGRKRR